MKYSSLLLFVALFFSACSSNGGNPVLDAKSFSEKLKATPNAVLLDVRTPEEFSKEYIEGALLADWNSDDFQRRIDAIDKNAPVFVYCLSGGRSSSAAKKMRNDGFKEVYELDGGIMQWRSNNLPETTHGATPKQAGMSIQQFEKITKGNKLVLVDFNAEWCAPCKKMLPMIEEISASMQDVVKVEKIDVDVNSELATTLKVESIPMFILYKNGTEVWKHLGLIEKDKLIEAINQNSK